MELGVGIVSDVDGLSNSDLAIFNMFSSDNNQWIIE